jgi:hypothetical protein
LAYPNAYVRHEPGIEPESDAFPFSRQEHTTETFGKTSREQLLRSAHAWGSNPIELDDSARAAGSLWPGASDAWLAQAALTGPPYFYFFYVLRQDNFRSRLDSKQRVRRPEKFHARLTQVRRFVVQSNLVFLGLYFFGKSKWQAPEIGSQAKLLSNNFYLRWQGPNIPMIGQGSLQKGLFRIEAFGDSRNTLIESAGLLILKFGAVRTSAVCPLRLRWLQEVFVAALDPDEGDDLAT